jgi:hypothetical protein
MYLSVLRNCVMLPNIGRVDPRKDTVRLPSTTLGNCLFDFFSNSSHVKLNRKLVDIAFRHFCSQDIEWGISRLSMIDLCVILCSFLYLSISVWLQGVICITLFIVRGMKPRGTGRWRTSCSNDLKLRHNIYQLISLNTCEGRNKVW